MTGSPRFRSALALVALLLGLAPTVSAGIFGVPTNLSTTTGAVCTGPAAPDAGCTAASGNPPGWLVLNNSNYTPTPASATGDVVHQMRFYIEVTGPTLQIKVFDPFIGPASAPTTSGARDFNNVAPSSTRYRLLDPAGNNYNAGGGGAEGQPITGTSDTVAGVVTENRLVQFGCNTNAAPTFELTNSTKFFGTGSTGGANCATALTPGLYIFEVTISANGGAGASVNAFGVQFTNSAGVHYSTYTIGRSDDDISTLPPSSSDNSLIFGRVNESGSTGLITEPVTFYPFVGRGCTFQTSNFDGGLNVAAEGGGGTSFTTAPEGGVTSLTVSNNNNHSENTIEIAPPNGPNFASTNYGMFPIQHTLGGSTLNNYVDWRTTDSISFATTSPSNLPNYGLVPVRTYLPNGYTGCNGTPGSCVFTAPVEPIFTTTAVVFSGPNPPVIGSATQFNINGAVYNPTSTALTNVRIVVPLTSAVTFVAASQSSSIDGSASACTDASTANARICTFANLAAGSTASLQFRVSVTPAAAGSFQITGIAPPQIFGVTSIVTAGGNRRATTAGANGYALGDRIRIVGANEDGFNGVWNIANINSGTQFDFTPPTGTIATATVPTGRLIYAQAICTGALNAPACATFEPAWRSAAVSPGFGSAGAACDLRANAIGGPVNLSITNADSPDPVALGSNITYAIAVTNTATGVAPNAQWTDTLPAGTTFVSLTPDPDWSCTTPQVGATGNVICSRPSMPVSLTENFTLVVQVNNATGTVSNTATVTSSAQEQSPGNNSATAVTTVNPGADLQITKSGSPNAQQSGGNIVFTLQVQNFGPSIANAPVVTDTLAGGGPWRFQSISAPGYGCVTPPVNSTGTITCTRSANMPVGSTDNISLTLSIVSGTGPIVNTATVTSTTPDPVAGNNSGSDTTSVVTTCSPTANGTLTTGIVNDYWPGTASAAAGATSITLGSRIAGGAGSTIGVGDFLLVMQMQDGTFNSTNTDAYGNGTAGDLPNTPLPGLRGPTLGASGSLLVGIAGKYEYVIAGSAVGGGGGALTITTPLKFSYTTSAPAFNAAGSNGQRTFQVIRVPVYNNLTLTGTMQARAWTGTSNTNSGGGVLAVEVNGTLTLAGFGFDASGRGFRGGRGEGSGNDNANSSVHVFQTDSVFGNNYGFKGEGINGSTTDLWTGTALVNSVSGYPGAAANNGNRAMGAPGNAGGGGSWDAAGGGGGNGGPGGGGGDEYCTAPGCQPGDLSSPAHIVGWTGGRGGLFSFTPSAIQVIMGGGGGGGADHNSDSGHGGPGGGTIIVRAVNVAGTGTVNANGATAPNPTSTGNAGGGGAGGSVILTESGAGVLPATVTITADGGNGGNSTDHAPGAGGGGGVIFVSPGSLALTSTEGGNNGFRSGSFPGNTNAEPGMDGFTGELASAPTPASADACGPVVDLSTTIKAPETAVAGNNIVYPITVSNNGPSAAPNTAIDIPVPPNSTFVSFSPPAGWTCTTPLVGGTGSVSCTRTGGDMPALTTENFTLTTRVDPGTLAGTVVPATAHVTTTANESNVANNFYADNTIIQQAAIAALTRATIRGFAADPLTGRIEFATGLQRNTASFNVYALADQRNPRDRELLNAGPIRSPFPNSMSPVIYKVETRPFGTSYLLIEEIELSGKTREMGPFAVGDPKLQASLSRIQRRLDRSGAAPVQISGVDVQFLPARNNRKMANYVQRGKIALQKQKNQRRGKQARDAGGAGLKIMVAGDGPVSVLRADLEAAGLPRDVKSGSLRLYLGSDRVSLSTAQGPSGEELRFDATATNTTYTLETAYVLTWSGNRPLTPKASLSSEADPIRPGFTRVEQNFVYLSAAPRGSDPWLWDLVIGNDTPWPYFYDPAAGDFDLPRLKSTSAPASVRVKVTAYSPLQHQVRAFINDVEVGSVEFEGSTTAMIDGTVPPGLLRTTGNQLSLRYSAVNATLEDPGYLYLDYFEVAADSFAPPRRVIEASAIEPYDPDLPAAALSSAYVIITHPDFVEPAQSLAALKRAQGRRAVVVDVSRLYDHYSGGFVEARAIRAFLQEAAKHGRIRNVVLFGDDTIDYRNYYGLTEFPVVPSLMGWDGEFGRVPSENQYADVDGDGAPDLSIGRLPAQTDADADALVAKVQRQQSVLQAQQGRHLMVVDNQGEGDPFFRGHAQQIVSDNLGSSPVSWSDLGDGIAAARSELLSGLATAPAVTHYFGHGGPEIWADEQVLTVDDVSSLSDLPESVFFHWACETQYFPYFYGQSLGEALMLQPTGGALASFGPSGISDSETQALFYKLLYAELANRRITLGEAIRRAKAEALQISPDTRSVVEGFNLIGDPSITLGGLKDRR